MAAVLQEKRILQRPVVRTGLPSTLSNELLLNADSHRPRIAMLSTHGYVAARPPLGAADTGGQVVYVLELAKVLGDSGFEVDIWTRQFEDQPIFERVSNHVRIIRVPCGGPNFIPKEYLYRKLPQWCRIVLQLVAKYRLRYQFLNSHYWDAGVAGDQLSEWLGVPHVHTPHSLGIWKKRQMVADFSGEMESFEKEYNFGERIRAERLIYDRAEMLVATSPQQLELLQRDYGVLARHVQMIPPGFDDRRFFPVTDDQRAAIRRRLGFTGKVVLALGRLAHNKGFDLLINGFAAVAREMPESRLMLAVGGTSLQQPENSLLSELKRKVCLLRLQDQVQFGNSVPDELLADFYRAADLFVLSSRYEPFGMTAIEAMASGTPTVLTCHGGLSQMLTPRHASFADPLDPQDLGNSMLEALRSPALSGMVQLAEQRVRSEFTWSVVARQLIRSVMRIRRLAHSSETAG